MDPLKALEFAAKYAWAALVAISFVLFIPVDVADQLGLSVVRSEYKGYLWISLVFTGTLSIAAMLSYINRKIFDGWLVQRRNAQKILDDLRKQKESLHMRLMALDDNEHMWIAYCLFNNVQTLSAEMTNTTANSLNNKRILVKGSGSMLDLPFHIADPVWDYLVQNKKDFLPIDAESNQSFHKNLQSFRRSLSRSYG